MRVNINFTAVNRRKNKERPSGEVFQNAAADCCSRTGSGGHAAAPAFIIPARQSSNRIKCQRAEVWWGGCGWGEGGGVNRRYKSIRCWEAPFQPLQFSELRRRKEGEFHSTWAEYETAGRRPLRGYWRPRQSALIRTSEWCENVARRSTWGNWQDE